MARSQPHDRRTNLLLVRKVQENLKQHGEESLSFYSSQACQEKESVHRILSQYGKISAFAISKVEKQINICVLLHSIDYFGYIRVIYKDPNLPDACKLSKVCGWWWLWWWVGVEPYFIVHF